MKKKGILLLVLLLAVGFAAVTTTLFINGTISYETNKSDFDVYYSKAKVNGVEDNSVITDNTHIVFERVMKKVGETYVLDYDVTNGSRNYDANLTMTCTESNEYLSVTNVFDTDTNLEATETRSGKLTIELKKGYAGETTKDVTIECTINANAVERNILGEAISVGFIPTYFAFGTPTTASTTDYTTLGKNVFATLGSDGTTGGICINDEGLFCIKGNDYDNSVAAIKAHFGEYSCADNGSFVYCDSGDFYCNAYSNGDVECYDNSAGEICNAYADGSFYCF